MVRYLVFWTRLINKNFMYKVVFFCLLVTLVFCDIKVPDNKLFREVGFTVVELSKSERDTLSNYGCIPWNDGIVEKFKKVMVVNYSFDTLHIPVYNCIKGTNTPFIEYDKLEFFEFDSTKASDLIFGPVGYEIFVLRNDTASLLLKVPDKRKKHKFFVDTKADSAGMKISRYFSFLE